MTISNHYQNEFDAEFPQNIAYLDRHTAKRLLSISDSYLRRDCSMLSEVSEHLPGWNHLPGSRGFDRGTFFILWLFRRFCRDLGRGKGLEILINELNKENNTNGNR